MGPAEHDRVAGLEACVAVGKCLVLELQPDARAAHDAGDRAGVRPRRARLTIDNQGEWALHRTQEQQQAQGSREHAGGGRP